MEQEQTEIDSKDASKQKLIPHLKSSFTVPEAIESYGFSSFQYVLCAICGLSWFSNASEIMLLAILGPSLHCEWQLTNIEQALCTTCVFAGWMVGSPLWGRVCDVYGRRFGLMVCSAIGLIAGVLTAATPSLYFFLFARFVVGIANGGLAQSVTLTSEFLPSATKTRWLIFLKSFWAFGTVALTAMAIVVLPSLGWRWLVVFSSIPIGLFGLCSWWLPESIRYDVANGKITEARGTLDRIAKFNGRQLLTGDLVVEEKVEAGSSSMIDLLKPLHRRTTVLLWLIWAMFGFLYYGTAIFTSLLLHSPVDQCGPVAHGGHDEVSEKIKREACRMMTTENYQDIIVTTMSEVPGYILLMYAVDYFGNKKSFAMGFLVYSLCSAVMTVCLPRYVTIGALFLGRMAIAAVYQVGYIYTGEVYPTALRAQGLGASSGWGRFGVMLTSFVTSLLFKQNLIFPAIVFAGVGVVGAILSILLPIETNGRAIKKAQALRT